MRKYHESRLQSLEGSLHGVQERAILGIKELLDENGIDRVDFMGEVEYNDGTTVDLSSFWNNCDRPYTSVFDHRNDCFRMEEIISCDMNGVETELTHPLYGELTPESCFQVYRCLHQLFVWKANYDKAAEVKSHFSPVIVLRKAQEQSFLCAYDIRDAAEEDFNAILYVWQTADGYKYLWGCAELYHDRAHYPWVDILQSDAEFSKMCMEAVINKYNILD